MNKVIARDKQIIHFYKQNVEQRIENDNTDHVSDTIWKASLVLCTYNIQSIPLIVTQGIDYEIRVLSSKSPFHDTARVMPVRLTKSSAIEVLCVREEHDKTVTATISV